jgi:hypothetical protein
MALVVPGKFVLMHMPRTGGMWLTEQLLQSAPEAFELEPRHLAIAELPSAHGDLPVVAVARDPVDWLCSHYSHRHNTWGWDPANNVLDRYRTDSIDHYAEDLIAHHRGLMTEYARAYLDAADFVLAFEDLVAEATQFAAMFGISIASPVPRNAATRKHRMSGPVADRWRRSNADYSERYGYPLPAGPVYSYEEPADAWRKTVQRVLRPRYRGKPVRLLEIGVLEGHGAEAAFDLLLTHPLSRYYGIDNWSASPRYRAERNLAMFSGGRHHLATVGSAAEAEFMAGEYDLIYVDGGREETDRANDLEKWWPRLRVGGLMVVNDYGDGGEHGRYRHVRAEVDQFIAGNGPRLTVVHSAHQIILRKD